MHRALSRTGRTLLQLIAAGGCAGIVAAIADGLSAWTAGIVLAAGQLAATFVQNLLESHGTVPPVFEPPHAQVPPKP